MIEVLVQTKEAKEAQKPISESMNPDNTYMAKGKLSLVIEEDGMEEGGTALMVIQNTPQGDHIISAMSARELLIAARAIEAKMEAFGDKWEGV
jgi:hypothetical protein